MLSKAKTLTGEWVTGWLVYQKTDAAWYWSIVSEKDGKPYHILYHTLCRQVPSKDWFVGDEVKWGGNFLVVGYVVFDEKSMSYKIENEQGRMIITDNWKPTGKNKHDDE